MYKIQLERKDPVNKKVELIAIVEFIDNSKNFADETKEYAIECIKSNNLDKIHQHTFEIKEILYERYKGSLKIGEYDYVVKFTDSFEILYRTKVEDEVKEEFYSEEEL